VHIYIWDDTMKIYVREIVYETSDWIKSAQSVVQWWVFLIICGLCNVTVSTTDSFISNDMMISEQ
jgi:hypothetical protein